MLTDAPLTIAVVGTGTIGLSWARLFASHGHHVRLFDPRPDLEAIAQRLAAETEAEVEVCQCLTGALAGANLVQESGPESLEAKTQLFADLAEIAPADCVLASSSSAILPSAIAARLSDAVAARILIAHPFNPPHVMPLVELVPGERTDPGVLTAAEAFYRSLGREPVVLAREARGFIGNRLQNAVLREAVHLVEHGVATAADVDAVLQTSLGIRWASIGLFAGMELGGGEAGFRGFMEHIGPSLAAIEPATPDMSAEGMEPVFAQVDAAYPSAAALAARRDRMQAGILQLRAELAEDAEFGVESEAGAGWQSDDGLTSDAGPEASVTETGSGGSADAGDELRDRRQPAR